MKNPSDDNQLPTSGSKNTFDMNAASRPAQPKFDAYRKESAGKFVRHPPKNTKTVTKSSYNDPNTVGNANLAAQIAIAREQDAGDVDGL